MEDLIGKYLSTAKKKKTKTYFAGAFSVPGFTVIAELVAVDEPAWLSVHVSLSGSLDSIFISTELLKKKAYVNTIHSRTVVE